MRLKMPAYVPFMIAVTAAYLTVEIPFSVHLVEVMGGSPTQSDIDGMEGFGRILTGIAVSIWIVGALVFPRMGANGSSFFRSLAVAAAVTVASTAATYGALEQVAAFTGHSTDGTERKEAFISNLARGHISRAGGTGDLRSTGENDWNTFIAVAPMLFGKEAMVSAAGMDGEALAMEEAARLAGSPDEYRQKVFGPAFDGVRSSYASYADGSKEYLDAKRNLARDADKAWETFLAECRKDSSCKPGRGFYHAAIVNKLRRAGVPVSDDWTITDKAGFVGPYMQVASKRIEEKYAEAVKLRLNGTWIAPGLDIDGFAAHPYVQKQIRQSLRLPLQGAAVTPGMDGAAFRSAVYAPMLAKAQADLAKAAKAPASAFENGDFADVGIAAVKAARLPAMAILLSIAGAALHIFKVSGYLAQAAGYAAGVGSLARGFSRHAFGAAVAVSAFASMAMHGNSVTGTEAFAGMKAEGMYASLLEGAISIQPRFSSFGSLIGSVGGWQAFAAGMPAPVRVNQAAAVTADAVAVAIPDVSRIPIPGFLER